MEFAIKKLTKKGSRHGPFTEMKELIAGFILLDVKSREEAIELVMRMREPNRKDMGKVRLNCVKNF
ncbi:YciI family protein [Bacillus sp. FJAT-49736]|uniref:YciI family protein n=1 Tax=Bacillus sp. FJAT-49736 TaxID=2833582 RepID=UPI0024B4C376|nr:YciI family protein [Bacillus sp. FJAT-49736]